MSPAAVAVRRARVHDTRGDPLAAELRLARLFAAADVATGLPHGSRLIVRNLPDPLPGALGGERHALRPPAAWERALGSSLFEIARTAARPARGAVPAGANAVFFADEAEWLACFARDVADRVAPIRWWWAEALPASVPPRIVLARALVSWAAVVPAAFALLAQADSLAPVLATLDDTAAAEAIAAAVAERFRVLLPTPVEEGADAGSPRMAAGPHATALAATLARVVPEALEPPSPSIAVRRLAVLVLVLRRAPALTRAELFPAALEALVRFPPQTTSVDEPRARSRPPTAYPGPPPDTVVRHARAPSIEHGPVLRPVAPEAADLQLLPPPSPGDAAVEPQPVAVEVEPGQTVSTQLGGVLFLVNVLLALGVYGDFTQPRSPGLELDFWRCLALLGTRLLARRPQRRDPLWALLAELAGPDAPHDWDEGDAIARAALCVRARLRAAGVQTNLLLRRPGRIEVGETRLDATFELVTHPIEIRLAALDHDPGFVPAAGRTLAFHFT